MDAGKNERSKSDRVAPAERVLLNEADAREALGGISRAKLHDLVATGQLNAVKLGPGKRAGVRFRIEDIKEFARTHVVTPGERRPSEKE